MGRGGMLCSFNRNQDRFQAQWAICLSFCGTPVRWHLWNSQDPQREKALYKQSLINIFAVTNSREENGVSFYKNKKHSVFSSDAKRKQYGFAMQSFGMESRVAPVESEKFFLPKKQVSNVFRDTFKHLNESFGVNNLHDRTRFGSLRKVVPRR